MMIKRLGFLLLLPLMACTRLPDNAPATPLPQATAVTPTDTTIGPEFDPVPTPMDLMLRPTEVIRVVTPTPPATSELVVCQAQEPGSLFLFGEHTAAELNVLQGLYENLVTQRVYGYQAQGLVRLPSLENGDAVIRAAPVQAGDTVVGASGEVVALGIGTLVTNAAGVTVAYDGSPLEMVQMSVNFTLQPLVWSDGVPVTAADSVFGFVVNRNNRTLPDLPRPMAERVRRTAAYEETGALTLRWTGIPGWLDPTFFLNVWAPLPRHHLGRFGASVLRDAPEASRAPLATGPFVLETWQPGQFIRLTRNPYYYRAAAGLPYLDAVTFRFVADANQLAADLLAGRCHIGTPDAVDFEQTPFYQEAAQIELLRPHFRPEPALQMLALGIDSAGTYGDGVGRPDWFDDVRVRQALALCLDRKQLAQESTYGESTPWFTFTAPDHRMTPMDLHQWAYDPIAAKTLLAELGLAASDDESLRRDPLTGRLFEITLHYASGSEGRRRLAERIAAQWLACGIDVSTIPLPDDELYAPGPAGPVYGRQFDVAIVPVTNGVLPSCQYWHSGHIPGPIEEGFEGWQAANVSGWRDNVFDVACNRALSSLVGRPEHLTAYQETLTIFADQLPAIPLFPTMAIAVTRPEVQNFYLDPTEPSALWNLFELSLDG